MSLEVAVEWVVVLLHIKEALGSDLGPGNFATCFLVVYCLAYSSTLKMEAIWSSETSADYMALHPRRLYSLL
jgi:hypothetical protein